MRLIAIALIVALMPAATVSRPSPYEQRMAKDAIIIAEISKTYALNFWGETFLRALAMHEFGPEGNELGHDNPRANRECYGNPCLRDSAQGYAQGTSAFLRAMQSFCLADPTRRREFMLYFARFYYCGGGADSQEAGEEANKEYARIQRECFNAARKRMDEMGKKDGTYSPLSATIYEGGK
jgi:hypothetical protein